MKVFTRFEDVGTELAGAALAIGNFDGLHRGHRALIERARSLAGPQGTCGVLTFEPHPSRILASQLAPPLLSTAEEKLAGLEALGVDVVLAQGFDRAFASTPPEAFVDDVLLGALQVRHVVVGQDFTFGRGGSGDVTLLQERLAAGGAELSLVAPVKHDGVVCSSTRIRQFVLEGRVAAAAELLGRPYGLEGTVQRGDGRGRTIGIPTANLETDRETLPQVGVYATWAITEDGTRHPSVTNIGLRPTFKGEGVRIEAHLLDFPRPGERADLYGQRLRLEFVERIRDEQRFSGADALREQIDRDIAHARQVLARDHPAG